MIGWHNISKFNSEDKFCFKYEKLKILLKIIKNRHYIILNKVDKKSFKKNKNAMVGLI